MPAVALGRRLIVALSLLAVTAPAAAVDRSFNVVAGDWNDPNSWNPAGVPGAMDVAIIASGTATLNANAMVGGLTLSGGTLTGTGTLTVNGLVTWTGGTMSGAGVTVAAAGMNLGGGGKVLDQRTVRLSGGTAAMNAPFSFIGVANGGVFDNQATFELSNDNGNSNQQGFFLGGAGGGTFTNSGTLRKTATGNSGSSEFSNVVFDNTGTVEVLAGTLRLNGGGTSPSGTFTTAAPATLAFGGTHQLGAATSVSGPGTVDFTSSGTTTVAGSYAVTGTTRASGATGLFSGMVQDVGGLEISSGGLTFSSAAPAVQATTLVHSGGTLSGDDTVSCSGLMTWTAGTMSGAGVTVAAAGMNLGGGGKTLNQRTVRLTGGTAAMNAPFSFIGVANGGVFDNQATFELSNDNGFSNQQGFFLSSGAATFTNSGTLRKTATGNTGVSEFSIVFDNTGTVELLAASTRFTGGYTQTAGVTRLNGGSLQSSSALALNGGRLEGQGMVDAAVSSSAETGPGLSPGLLTVSGAFTKTATAALSVEIGGLTAGAQYDRLAVNGAATLAGALNVALSGGFAPQLGQMFDIMTFASRSGQFGQLNGLDIGNGLAFDVVYLSQSVQLQVVQGTPTTPSPTTVSSPSATPSPTPTSTATGTATRTLTPTGSATVGSSATPTATGMSTATVPDTPTATPTATPSTSPTATPSPSIGSSPTPTSSPIASPTASATRSPTATPISTAPSTATQSPTASLGPSPTATAMVPSVTIGGFVFRPGRSGLVGVEGAMVEAFICNRVTLCLDNPGNPVATAITNRSGQFTMSIPAERPPNTLLLFNVTLDGVLLRSVLVTSPLPARLVDAGDGAGIPSVTIDPVSEAAVRLLAVAGLENFNDAGIAAVVEAVRDANAATVFDDLSVAAATTLATDTASDDPEVQRVLSERTTPTPTAPCPGDCDGTGVVTVGELVRGVNIVLGSQALASCPAFDRGGDGGVTIDDLIAAVNALLTGCPASG